MPPFIPLTLRRMQFRRGLGRYRRRFRRRPFGSGRRRFPMVKPEINYKEFFTANSYGSVPSTELSNYPAVWNMTSQTAGSHAGLTQIAVGSAVTERVGRKIAIRSIQIKAICESYPDHEANTAYNVHMALVRFKNQQGRNPNTANIWKVISAGVSAAPIRDQDHLRDYEIIFHKKTFIKHDWEYAATDGTTGTDPKGGVVRQIDIYKKFKKPLFVNYYAATTAPEASNIESGGLYMFVWHDHYGSSFSQHTRFQEGLILIKFLDL